jgi:hypothetical protein
VTCSHSTIISTIIAVKGEPLTNATIEDKKMTTQGGREVQEQVDDGEEILDPEMPVLY